MWDGRRLHSQRKPLLNRVQPVEAPPVYGSIHGIVADPSQGFQGAGSKRRGHIPKKREWCPGPGCQ